MYNNAIIVHDIGLSGGGPNVSFLMQPRTSLRLLAKLAS